MSDTDAQIAAPSAAAETSTPDAPARSLDDLSPSELQSWRLTGDVPPAAQTSPSSTPADSTPAEPAAQAASTDASSSPDSEPGKPGKKANADTRVQELLRERHTDRTQLAELRQRLEAYERAGQPQATPQPSDASQAASSPAAADTDDFPDFDAWSAQAENEGKSYDAYTRAMVRHDRAQAQIQEQRAAEVRTKVATFNSRYEAAKAADPTFIASLSADVLALQPVDALPPGAPVSPLNVVAQEIIESEHAPQLLRHFSAHPEQLDALRTAAPATIFRTLARLESDLRLAGAPSAVSPSAPPITKAPDPPTTLGSRPAAPVNEAEAAVARDDVAAYMAARNREAAGASA